MRGRVCRVLDVTVQAPFNAVCYFERDTQIYGAHREKYPKTVANKNSAFHQSRYSLLNIYK